MDFLLKYIDDDEEIVKQIAKQITELCNNRDNQKLSDSEYIRLVDEYTSVLQLDELHISGRRTCNIRRSMRHLRLEARNMITKVTKS